MAAGSRDNDKLEQILHRCAEIMQERVDAFERTSDLHKQQIIDLEASASEAHEAAHAKHAEQVSALMS